MTSVNSRGSDALTCWAAAIVGPNADAASRMTFDHRSRVPGISAMLSLCTNSKSNHCASAFGACRHAGIAWRCRTIREAEHGDKHRGAKGPMPTSWRHANMWALFGCSASRHGVRAFGELADRYPCMNRPYHILDTKEPVTYPSIKAHDMKIHYEINGAVGRAYLLSPGRRDPTD